MVTWTPHRGAPGTTIVAVRSSARASVVSLAALGVTYAVFSFLLYRSGVAARAVLLPIEPADYYLSQTLFVGPLLVACAALFASVVRGVAAPSTVVTYRDGFHRLAPLYAWPLLLLFVVPDLCVFLSLGHGSLARAMRFYAPLAPLAIVVLGARCARRLFSISLGRAVVAAIAGLLAQALLGALFLR